MTALTRAAIPGLPDSLLDDCLLDMGRRGSGKSFLFRVAMERALTKKMRAGWIDATGVGWGVTVTGTPDNLRKPAGPGYEVVVFGGDHGKIALVPTMGAALGRQLAKASFSWVLDISKFPSKRSRVQFMRDFLDAIYEGCAEPMILFVDEADLWAPQMILDKTGPSAELLGIMDDIIRRGRVKGLSLWMSTQRPAAISKQVISQVEALITFKLVMPHDLDAAMLWIEDHLDKAQAKEIRVKLPSLQIGEAIVYLTDPKISIIQRQFPLIQTLDTFGRPEKGAVGPSDKQMAYVDIATIQAELGEIAKEIEANDPATLRARIRELEKAASVPPAKVEAPDQSVIEDAACAAYAEGFQEGTTAGFTAGAAAMRKIMLEEVTAAPDPVTPYPGYQELKPARAPVTLSRAAAKPASPMRPEITITAGDRTGPEKKILTALAEWKAIGFTEPSREQVAILAGYHVRTGSYLNALGALRSAGMIDYGTGTLSLTANGISQVKAAPFRDPEQLHARIRTMLDGPQTKIFDVLVGSRTGKSNREQLAADAGYHIRTGSFLNALGRLRSLTVIDYERPNGVALRPWVFLENRT